MRLGPFQLCTCLNAFPGTGLDSKLEVLRKRLPLVRASVQGGLSAPFAAGLWLDAASVSSIMKARKARDFAEMLRSLGLYAFTANAFPFGRFHDGPVKTEVYKPDWSSSERLEFTCAVAEILKETLPEGMEGSISTLPAAYRGAFKQKDAPALRANLIEAGRHLRRIFKSSGKRITLAVEMEPDCLWECPEEFCDYFDRNLRDDEASEFIGICYDTCHQELLATRPGQGLETFLKRGVKVAKIQLSSAIAAPDAASKKTLERHFQDTVYLHQTRAFTDDGSMIRFPDLPEALASKERERPWKVHFHVPVFLEGIEGGLLPAKDELEAVIGRLAKEPSICSNLEIETYSYNVLPDFSKDGASIETGMAREMEWVAAKLSGAGM